MDEKKDFNEMMESLEKFFENNETIKECSLKIKNDILVLKKEIQKEKFGEFFDSTKPIPKSQHRNDPLLVNDLSRQHYGIEFKDQEDEKMIFLCGPSGVGKTRKQVEEAFFGGKYCTFICCDWDRLGKNDGDYDSTFKLLDIKISELNNEKITNIQRTLKLKAYFYQYLFSRLFYQYYYLKKRKINSNKEYFISQINSNNDILFKFCKKILEVIDQNYQQNKDYWFSMLIYLSNKLPKEQVIIMDEINILLNHKKKYSKDIYSENNNFRSEFYPIINGLALCVGKVFKKIIVSGTTISYALYDRGRIQSACGKKNSIIEIYHKFEIKKNLEEIWKVFNTYLNVDRNNDFFLNDFIFSFEEFEEISENIIFQNIKKWKNRRYYEEEFGGYKWKNLLLCRHRMTSLTIQEIPTVLKFKKQIEEKLKEKLSKKKIFKNCSSYCI